MAYISVKKAAEQLGVTPRWIQKLCEDKRIPGVLRLDGSNVWMIPDDFALHIGADREPKQDRLEQRSK